MTILYLQEIKASGTVVENGCIIRAGRGFLNLLAGPPRIVVLAVQKSKEWVTFKATDQSAWSGSLVLLNTKKTSSPGR